MKCSVIAIISRQCRVEEEPVPFFSGRDMRVRAENEEDDTGSLGLAPGEWGRTRDKSEVTSTVVLNDREDLTQGWGRRRSHAQ